MDCPTCGGWICEDPVVVGDSRICPVCEQDELRVILNEAIKLSGLKAEVSPRGTTGNAHMTVKIDTPQARENNATIVIWLDDWPTVLAVYRYDVPFPHEYQRMSKTHKVDLAAPDGLVKLANALKELV